jgi:hypothetical protein
MLLIVGEGMIACSTGKILLVSVIWHTDYIEYKEYEFLYNKFLENIYSKNINVITPKIMENYFKAILNNL